MERSKIFEQASEPIREALRRRQEQLAATAIQAAHAAEVEQRREQILAGYAATRERLLALFALLDVRDRRGSEPQPDPRHRNHYFYAHAASTPEIVLANVQQAEWSGSICAKITAKLPERGKRTGLYLGWEMAEKFSITTIGRPSSASQPLLELGLESIDRPKSGRQLAALDEALPAFTSSLDHIVAATADRRLNPQLAPRP